MQQQLLRLFHKEPTALYKVEVENPGGLGVLSSQSITNSNAPVYITSSGSLGEFNELDSVSVQIEAYNEDSTGCYLCSSIRFFTDRFIFKYINRYYFRNS